MGKRKRYTADEKMKILREVLEDGKPISQIAEAYGMHPNSILTWRTKFREEEFYEKRSNFPFGFRHYDYPYRRAVCVDWFEKNAARKKNHELPPCRGNDNRV